MDDHQAGGAAVASFSRPRYFYGQLLDVHHFESEQEYFKRKLWLLNRTVSGYGVVCGLDVTACDDGKSVVVAAGLALDKCGREIVVPCRSKPVVIDPAPPKDYEKKDGYKDKKDDEDCDDDWVHLVICYHECRTDPEPVLTSGCDDSERSSPGAVRETYELRLDPGKAEEIPVDCAIPNLIKGNCVNYRALAEWVSQPCEEHRDPCITLANIRRPVGDGTVTAAGIDISVRPIVYGLDLLWQLILSLSHETQNRRTGKH
jgi:hypothetical protein